jgi:hypothetical protein
LEDFKILNKLSGEDSKQVTKGEGMFSKKLGWGFQIPFFQRATWLRKSPSKNLVRCPFPERRCKSLSTLANLVEEVINYLVECPFPLKKLGKLD